jgi:hypothetical protein
MAASSYSSPGCSPSVVTEYDGHADLPTTLTVYGDALSSDFEQTQAAAMLHKALAAK